MKSLFKNLKSAVLVPLIVLGLGLSFTGYSTPGPVKYSGYADQTLSSLTGFTPISPSALLQISSNNNYQAPAIVTSSGAPVQIVNVGSTYGPLAAADGYKADGSLGTSGGSIASDGALNYCYATTSGGTYYVCVAHATSSQCGAIDAEAWGSTSENTDAAGVTTCAGTRPALIAFTMTGPGCCYTPSAGSHGCVGSINVNGAALSSCIF